MQLVGIVHESNWQAMNIKPLIALVVLLGCVPVARAAEADAIRISTTVQSQCLPQGTILGPVFDSPTSNTISHYSRGGDSALWTGVWVASEAYRWRVTHSEEALSNVVKGLKAMRKLVRVTGTGVLARCRLSVAWEDIEDRRAVITEEAGHGIYRSTLKSTEHYWIGNTSRDQYVGVFFGLGVAYELIDETAHPKVRTIARKIASDLLDNLIANNWTVRMPNGAISTTFIGRADQRLALLQVGRLVHASKYAFAYETMRREDADLVPVVIGIECLNDHDSYFKFNLAYLSMYSLLHYEEEGSPARGSYRFAYNLLRGTTAQHGNAHFNVIDLALDGPDTSREAETMGLLDDWLERPIRDEWVDLRNEVPMCSEERACFPIPVKDRVRTDFLWQRSPFLAFGGGDGTIASPGLDYVLPYWMGRFYGES
jgi:hypothetical protein